MTRTTELRRSPRCGRVAAGARLHRPRAKPARTPRRHRHFFDTPLSAGRLVRGRIGMGAAPAGIGVPAAPVFRSDAARFRVDTMGPIDTERSRSSEPGSSSGTALGIRNNDNSGSKWPAPSSAGPCRPGPRRATRAGRGGRGRRPGEAARDEGDRQDALEKLWDPFERLKTLEPGANKRAQTEALLDRVAAPGSAFREALGREAAELTSIGNSFRIRHSEVTQEALTSTDQIDYPFTRMFAFLRMVLKGTGRGG